jgi:hypothetical protein
MTRVKELVSQVCAETKNLTDSLYKHPSAHSHKRLDELLLKLKRKNNENVKEMREIISRLNKMETSNDTN